MKNFDTHKFLKILDKKNIKYHYENEWLVIGGDKFGDVDLYDKKIKYLPNYIKFNNEDWVDLSYNNLTSLPNNIEFNNGNDVHLSFNHLTSLPDDIQFNNKKDMVFLNDNPLESLPDNIEDFYERLDEDTKKYIKDKFPDHIVNIKRKFNL